MRKIDARQACQSPKHEEKSDAIRRFDATTTHISKFDVGSLTIFIFIHFIVSSVSKRKRKKGNERNQTLTLPLPGQKHDALTASQLRRVSA